MPALLFGALSAMRLLTKLGADIAVLGTEYLCRRAPERILFCGWRRDMHDMIAVLDAFVYPGSELWLYNEVGMLLVMCCRDS